MRHIISMVLAMAMGIVSFSSRSQASQIDDLHSRLVDQGVPEAAAAEALLKYDVFKDQVQNLNSFVIVDMTQSSEKSRFYIVDSKTGNVEAISVAHGAGSDPQNTGFAHYFSNVPDSHMSSLGAYLIQEKYRGKHGPSLRLDGLEASNNNARNRTIVLHPANYVKEGGQSTQGRSWGCPAVAYAQIDNILAKLQGGAFMYIYGVNEHDTNSDLRALRDWAKVPVDQWPDESE